MMEIQSILQKIKVLSTRKLHRGRSFAFETEEVTLPNGRQTSFDLVRHPGSTVIVPLHADGAITLTYQYRHPMRDFVYEIPAGTLEPGEDPQVCAGRELEEETGFRAGELISLGEILIVPSYSDEVCFAYLAGKLSPTQQNLDEDEIIQVETRPAAEVLAMISDGRISDALSIAAIHRALPYLGPYLKSA